MAIFLCRWPNGSFTIVGAANKAEAVMELDEIGNADGAEIRRMPSCMLDFELVPPAASDEVESGVYGFSGAMKGGSPSGVIGECIWIYDADNKKQIAKGDCDEGNFRVVLKPGTYVVRGPGGNQKIEVKPHQWIKIKSMVELPGQL